MSNTYEALRQQVQELIEAHHGMIRTKELNEAGISYKQVLRLTEDGTIVRAKSGYYSLSGAEFSQEELLVSMYSDCVLTMESALYYHGYLLEQPAIWHLAVSKNTSKTRFANAPFAVAPYYTEDRVLPIGAETITLDQLRDKNADTQSESENSGENNGGTIRVYNIDRLICDVLKYEEKLDREDFKSAVRSYIDDEHKDVARLLSYAKERKVLKKVQTMIGVWL